MSLVMKVEDWLAHYGTPRKSGRYPWGSGTSDEKMYEGSFLDITSKMRRDGVDGKKLTDAEIAKGFGLTTTEYRARRSIESNERKIEKTQMVEKLYDRGHGASAIEKQTGIPESSVRSIIAARDKEKAQTIHTIADVLKSEVDDKQFVQIGKGVEHLPPFGIAANRLKNAVAILEEEGYKVHSVQVDQLGSPGNKTTVKILTRPGTTYRDAVANKENIKIPGSYSDDGGKTFFGIKPPLNIDPKRVKVVYKGEGGEFADGVIHVRPGKDDISLGGKNYAQVRIAVGGTHYLKGMAVYKDDLPPGVDLQFNTNKERTNNKLDALKKQSDDPQNPFGSQIHRQILDEKGEKPTSAMNIVNEEGRWADWNKSLSSQVLSKQSPALAKQQLEVKRERMKTELEELKSLTNPTVRRHLLEKYADGADASAVHLDAAHINRQSTHAILPVKSLKQTEVYAPNYDNGETVVLIRFPHGGKFEIPELQVNNKNREAIKMMGKNAPDAIGIHPKVAEKLSGADFDGDTVLVIPNPPNKARRIQSEPMLKSLQKFDPHGEYKLSDDVPRVKAKTKNVEMGKISNLITDMTIKGADNDKLARAVKHSMVVIDAEKHHLDYKRSARDFGIAALAKEYQEGKGGASTLISRSGSTERLPETRPRRASEGGPIDPKTGRKMEVPKYYLNKDGEKVFRNVEVNKLARATDAHTLVSKERTLVEVVYADHSNALKGFANEARKEVYKFKPTRVDLHAKKAYKNEVASLVSKLNIARANAPLERQAQIFANAMVAKQIEAKPYMDEAEKKKIKGQALATARVRVQAKKTQIAPTDEEWAAIQAGAVSQHQLKQILDNADLDRIRELATPRTRTDVSPAMGSRARAMAAQGFNQAEIASALGMSTTTIRELIE